MISNGRVCCVAFAPSVNLTPPPFREGTNMQEKATLSPVIEPLRLYSPEEVSDLLAIGLPNLAGERREGRLKSARKGRSRVFLGRWLLDWLEQPGGRDVNVEDC